MLKTRLLKPDRSVIYPGSPGWDQPFPPRRRSRSNWWERLSGSRDAGLAHQPGSCCGCPSGPGIACGSCTIPDTLSLTDGNGTIAFNYNPDILAWQGSYLLSLSNIIVQIGSTGGSSPELCGLQGTGDVVVVYTGTCANLGGGVFQFMVSMAFGWGTSLGTSPDCAGFGITWLLLCTDPPFSNCNSNPVVYIQQGIEYAPVPAFAGSLTQAWLTCSPFSWIGTISGIITPPAGVGTIAITP